MTKVKLMESTHIKALEDAINDFITERLVQDIKYRTVYDDRGSRLRYSAMILYYEHNEVNT